MFKYVKRFGQVFLRNSELQLRIAGYINNLNFQNLVEIGPGSGAITSHLNFENKEVILIEVDGRLISYLISKFPSTNVIHDDFLNVDFSVFKSNTLLFGNIPYNITSLIILRFFSNIAFTESVFMIQKECFEVINSEIGDKKYSSFTVLVRSLSFVKKVMSVGRKNFYPTPKVDSVVFHMIKKKDLVLNVEIYSAFLRKSFLMPRKTLWNNWKKIISEEILEKIFEANNSLLNKKIRPDEISPSSYLDLFFQIQHYLI